MRLSRVLVLATCVATLVGCNSSGSGLLGVGNPEPAVPLSGETTQPNSANALTTEPQNPQPAGQTRIAAVTSNARVEFAPVVGATPDAVAPLSRRLSTRAAERGIRLSGKGDRGTTHVVKGYFSAISEAGQTTVIYVWDVLDPAGNRLHRIQGQSKTRGGNGDAWSSVTDVTMETIADNTIQALAQWLESQTG